MLIEHAVCAQWDMYSHTECAKAFFIVIPNRISGESHITQYFFEVGKFDHLSNYTNVLLLYDF